MSEGRLWTGGQTLLQERATPSLREAVFVGGRLSPGWAAAFVSSLALMFGPSALLATTFGVFAAGLEAQTGWRHSDVAYASTLMSLVILFSSPVQGILADRSGGRRLVLVSMPLFAVCLMCLPLTTKSIELFYLNCVLLMVAGAGLWPLSYMKVVVGWFERRVGIALGIVMTGLGLSTAFLPILLGWSFRTTSWSATYVGLGIVIVLGIWPLTMLWLREAPRPVSATLAVTGTTFREALRSKVFWMSLPLFFTFGAISAALLVHGVAIIKSAGVPLEAALRIQATVGLGATAGRLATGWLLDRMAVRIIGSAMFGLASVTFLILSSDLAGSLAYLAAALGGLVIGAEFDVLGVLIRRHLGNATFGRVYGFVFAAFHLGGAFGSAMLALLLSRSGSFTVGLQGLLAASVACGILFVFIGRDPPTHAVA